MHIFLHSSLQNANSGRSTEVLDQRLRQVIAQVKYTRFLRFTVQTASLTCAIVQITPHRTKDRDRRVTVITRHRGWYISPSIAPVCMVAVTGQFYGGQPGSYTSMGAIVIILPAGDLNHGRRRSNQRRPAAAAERVATSANNKIHHCQIKY